MCSSLVSMFLLVQTESKRESRLKYELLFVLKKTLTHFLKQLIKERLRIIPSEIFPLCLNLSGSTVPLPGWLKASPPRNSPGQRSGLQRLPTEGGSERQPLWGLWSQDVEQGSADQYDSQVCGRCFLYLFFNWINLTTNRFSCRTKHPDLWK